MKRQVTKSVTMVMIVLALALASAAVAHGQSGRQVTVKVPFDFIVSDKTFRAGEYEVINMIAGGDALSVRQADSKASAMLLTSPIIKNDRQDTRAKLVFHRYGETYFLSEVWLSGRTNGRELAKSREER